MEIKTGAKGSLDVVYNVFFKKGLNPKKTVKHTDFI